MHMIRTAHICTSDARQAVAEFHAAVAQPHMALVLFFCSSRYDLDELAAEMERLFAGVQVIGCTTAGEIGPAGYRTHSLSGIGFAAQGFAGTGGLLEGLSRFDTAAGHTFVQQQLQHLEGAAPQLKANECFVFLMIDGMSMREEQVAYALQNELGDIPLVGGSAGDDMRFLRTYVYHGGRFYSDAAVMALVRTGLPFKVFKSQHLVPSNQRLVVTAADPVRRIVSEINGLPAAAEYARLTGMDPGGLGPASFAAFPVVVRVGGSDFVRSVQKVNADGSLTFYCAIEEGLVLRVAPGHDLIGNLERTFADIRSAIGEPQAVLACDCILRKMEIDQKQIGDRVGGILQQHRVVGFNSYGEQFHGLHVNQTLTGIAIGTEPEGGDA